MRHLKTSKDANLSLYNPVNDVNIYDNFPNVVDVSVNANYNDNFNAKKIDARPYTIALKLIIGALLMMQ